MGSELAPERVDTTANNVRKRWRRVQELICKVWNRWFLPTKNLKVGDVVLVIEPDTPRRDWKIGRMKVVYPGHDGLVRVVDVRSGGVLKRRTITRLSPLEAEVL